MSIIVPVVLALVGAPIFGGAKPVPINTRNLKWGEWGFALVALAGPLMNILLAFIFFLVGNMTGVLVNEGGSLGYYEVIGGIICSTGLLLNLGFALFNIIPIPPLDGSRILYALAPDFARNFMRNIEQYGLVIIYGFIFFCSSLFSAYLMSGQAMFINFFFWIVGVR
jgi:Zn-dependent protease